MKPHAYKGMRNRAEPEPITTPLSSCRIAGRKKKVAADANELKKPPIDCFDGFFGEQTVKSFNFIAQ